MKLKNVVIIGGNFAGISAINRLLANKQLQLNITLIDPEEQFNWTPNIHEVLSAVKQPKHVQFSRSFYAKQLGINFIQQKVVDIDHDGKQIHLSTGLVLDFDACILACGLETARAPAQAHEFNFKRVSDVERISSSIEKVLTETNQCKICIVGGGFSGVEVLGELLRKYRSNENVHLSLVDRNERLVQNLPSVIADNILGLAKPHNVSFYFERYVNTSSCSDLKLDNGHIIDCDISIWTIGSSLPALTTHATPEAHQQNGIEVDEYLRSSQSPACFIIGDAARYSVSATKLLPKQSYHATDMGEMAANNVINLFTGAPLIPYRPKLKPILLSFGDLNTYLISGDSVIASPVLAASKEAIYQLAMDNLLSHLTYTKRGREGIERAIDAIHNLLLPEFKATTPLKIVNHSCILQRGKLQDLVPLLNGIKASLALN